MTDAEMAELLKQVARDPDPHFRASMRAMLAMQSNSQHRS